MFHTKFNLIYSRVQLCGCYFMKFSTTAIGHGKQTTKLNRIMSKFLGNGKSKKKTFYESLPSGGTPEYLNFVANKQSAKVTHRVNVLNNIFMRNITDIMSTGEIFPEIIDKGIQISKVRVAPTFHKINVHWLANGNDEDEEIERLLIKLAPKLRHELSQLQLIGVVPKIEFIKDSSYFKYMHVENILQTADFGEGYKRTTLGHDWKSEYFTNKQSEVESLNEEADGKSNEKTSEELPVMRMDVFGLDHEKIMTKVLISTEKSKALHRKDLSKHPLPVTDVNVNEKISVIDGVERKRLIKEYFRKRMKDRKTANKENKRNSPENILREQELESRLANEFIKHVEDDTTFSDEGFDRNDNYADNYAEFETMTRKKL